MWISKQSSICRGGTRLGNTMDTILHMWNKNFSGNTNDLAKVLGADEETKSHLHWQFFGIWQVFWGIILESLYVNTAQIRNKWDCRKSSAQSERRDICGTVANRSGWKMVAGFHGVLLLSAKHSRSFIWWEDHHMKGGSEWSLVAPTYDTIWSNGLISPDFCEGPYRNCSNLVQKSWQEDSSVMFCMRSESGKETLWSQTLKNGGDGRIRTPRQKAQCKGSVNANERWQFYIPCRRWNIQIPWRRSTSETSHFNQGSSWTRRGTRSFSRRIRRTPFSNPSSRWLNTG